ncbi:MAG: hypothetical protein IPP25_00935 [Saprospiraceae bacterium]|nr:hypothetical protein [Candidatus Opimibacter skivensis]
MKYTKVNRIALILTFSLTFHFLLVFNLSAQVGIGTVMPDSSSILELSSSHKGFLMPRMSTSQRDAIVSPAVGLQLFNTDDQCIDLYDGANWNKNCSGSWTSEGPSMHPTSAQYVGIGTTDPDTSAILDLSSTNKGFLMPRMSTSQRDAIVSPAVGLQLFNTDDQCVDLYDGANWNKNCSGSWTSEGPSIHPTSAQYVGIGTTDPDTNAILDLSSTNKGFLMPRMTTIQRDAIVNPAIGLQIFNMDDQCIDLYDGVYWIKNCGLKQVGVGDSIGTNVWTLLNTNGPGVRENAFSFSIGSSVYIGTGSDGSVNYDDLWEYNTVTGIWTQKASMPGGVRNYAIGMSIGGKGYAGLGNNSSNYKLDFYEYDPVADTWTPKANFGGAARRGAAGLSSMVKPTWAQVLMGQLHSMTCGLIILSPIVGHQRRHCLALHAVKQ